MSGSPMKLILTQEVSGLGAPGEVVEVAGGYGRNYLVPRGLAMRWTRGAEKQIDLIKRARSAREIKGVDDAKAAAGQLAALNVRLQQRAGGGGRLFGSVSPGDITEAVTAAGGPVLDKRKIEIANPIKTVGAHQVGSGCTPRSVPPSTSRLSEPDRLRLAWPGAAGAASQPSRVMYARDARPAPVGRPGARLRCSVPRGASYSGPAWYAGQPPGQFRVKLGEHRPGPRQAVRDVVSRACTRLFPRLSRQIVDGLAKPREPVACRRTHSRTIGEAGSGCPSNRRIRAAGKRAAGRCGAAAGKPACLRWTSNS